MKYPAIHAKQLTGSEPILDDNGKPVAKTLDYWRWAYSDLLGNTERGAVAEFLVASALGISREDRISWNSYDLLSNEGIKVEVKASAYIQTWGQERLSDIRFGIQPTFAWDAETNVYDTEMRRQSDIYVFCVLKHTDQETIDPLDARQWDFYPLRTSVLNEKVGNQKGISLSKVQKLGAQKTTYSNLRDRIVELWELSEKDAPDHPEIACT